MPNKIPEIPIKNCESTSINGYGYHPESKTLAVEFKSGRTYHYPDYSADEFAKLEAAKSKGGHLQQIIRSKKFIKI